MKRDVDFLYEIGALRHLPRMWRRLYGTDVASITEHHYRVIWLALIIAAREKKGDVEKIMKMALVHDIGESRTGDADYLSRQYIVRKEEDAVEHMLAQTSLKSEFMKLWKAYEKRTSIEAKIVKDADNLDVDLEIREQAAKGATLSHDWESARAEISRTKFYTKTAKELYEQISTSNPNDWHVNSPYNRSNGGDWKR